MFVCPSRGQGSQTISSFQQGHTMPILLQFPCCTDATHAGAYDQHFLVLWWSKGGDFWDDDDDDDDDDDMFSSTWWYWWCLHQPVFPVFFLVYLPFLQQQAAKTELDMGWWAWFLIRFHPLASHPLCVTVATWHSEQWNKLYKAKLACDFWLSSSFSPLLFLYLPCFSLPSLWKNSFLTLPTLSPKHLHFPSFDGIHSH